MHDILCFLVSDPTSHASNGYIDVYDSCDSDDMSDDDSDDDDDDDDLLHNMIRTRHDHRALRHYGLNNNITRKLLTPEVSIITDNNSSWC